jgi:site-specific DNA recombinase
MNGVIYCRVSSKEQTEGTSLEFQESACREYAQKHGINVLTAFIERGESAKFADRTQLLALIDYCRAQRGKVESVIVWKLDRFSRNVSDHFSVKATLRKYGACIVSVTEPIDQNAEGRLMETILAGFAQFDNDIRALRTVQGMRKKIEDGIHPWRPPLGYRPLHSSSGQKKRDPDVPDRPLFGLLQNSWREFATGAYTKAQIQKLMTSWGILSRTGKPLAPQSIDNLFSNPFYAGIIVDPWSGERRQGGHLPMVSMEVFEQVQRIIHRRNKSIVHLKERDEFPLRGLVRCPHCRGVMTGGFSRGRSQKYPYYMCARRNCTDRMSYPTDPLHEEFEAFLDQVALKPDLLERLEAQLVTQLQNLRSMRGARAERRDTNLAQVKRALQGLIQMRAEGLISSAEFLEQKGLLEARRIALQKPLDDEASAYEEIRQKLPRIAARLVDLRSTWRAVPTELRSRFKRLLMPVGFAADNIRTASLGLLFSLSEGYADSNSSLGCLTGARLNQLAEELQAFSDLFAKMDELKGGPGEAVQGLPARVTKVETFEPKRSGEHSPDATNSADSGASA